MVSNEGNDGNDLVIAGSTYLAQPTMKQFDFKFISPHQFRVKAPNCLSEFNNHFIYLTFLSYTSKEIQVYAKFGQPKIQAEKI